MSSVPAVVTPQVGHSGFGGPIFSERLLLHLALTRVGLLKLSQ